jgi:hypothetical protein
MATDYAEKEKAFIESLAEDTGFDLDGWLNAIRTSGLTERNDIIDWLRQQGFAFAKASWIERIHHNGGRLIYGDGQSPAPIPVRAPVLAPMMPFAGKPPDRKAAEPAKLAPAPIMPQSAPRPAPAVVAMGDAGIAAVLSAAKGLRPLADVLVREIAAYVPGIIVKAEAPLLTFAAPKPFAALLPGPKELRLYGDFGSGNPGVKRTDAAARALVSYPHVVALHDVRQIDAAFATLITSACAQAQK